MWGGGGGRVGGVDCVDGLQRFMLLLPPLPPPPPSRPPAAPAYQIIVVCRGDTPGPVCVARCGSNAAACGTAEQQRACRRAARIYYTVCGHQPTPARCMFQPGPPPIVSLKGPRVIDLASDTPPCVCVLWVPPRGRCLNTLHGTAGDGERELNNGSLLRRCHGPKARHQNIIISYAHRPHMDSPLRCRLSHTRAHTGEQAGGGAGYTREW